MKDRTMEQIRGTLRALPVHSPPRELATRLRILASRERLRNSRRNNLSATLAFWLDHTRLWMNNLMRPLAIPAAGGLFAAVILFSMMAPALTVNRRPASDVPSALATEATLQSSLPVGLGDEEIVIDVVMDERGDVVDYSIPKGQLWFSNPAIRKNVESTLVFTRFTPATIFGQPLAGKTRIRFVRRSHLDVKG